MAGEKRTPEDRALLSKYRGREAAKMMKAGKPMKEVRQYISAQGDSEAAAMQRNMVAGKAVGFKTDIDEPMELHSGGTVAKDGIYRLKAGEKVIPAGKSSSTSSGGGRSMGERHTGAAENLRSGGPDESGVSRQNSPFRQLHEGGHMLNHGYKHPPAAISPDVAAARMNHSYLNPMHDGTGLRPEVPKQVWTKANAIKPITQQGTGKTGPARLS
jgi:hypothetical protein